MRGSCSLKSSFLSCLFCVSQVTWFSPTLWSSWHGCPICFATRSPKHRALALQQCHLQVCLWRGEKQAMPFQDFATNSRHIVCQRTLPQVSSWISWISSCQKFQEHVRSVASRACQTFQEHFGSVASRACQTFQEHVGSVASRVCPTIQEHVWSLASRACQTFQEHVGSLASRVCPTIQEHVWSLASRAYQKFQEYVRSAASTVCPTFQEHVRSLASRARQKFQ